MSPRRFGASLFAFMLAAVLPAVAAGPVSAATTGCIDWRDYAADTAPAGSGNLGLGSASNSQAAGNSVTLTDILGQDVDLRITWPFAHNGIMLDEGVYPDFVGVEDYLSAAGGASTRTVFRYFPFDDQHGQVTFEFLQGGTSTPASVTIDHLLIGGQRHFAGTSWGTSEFALESGGARVAATTTGSAATVDNDGGANGIVGLGTAPSVQLDLPNFGSPAATAYNSTRNSFVTVGTESTRDWTVLDWGSPTADTVVWDLYGSGDPSGPQPDPAAVDPAAFVLPHGGLSAYISGFCLTIPDPPSYDLALAKVISGYDAATGLATYQITVVNQGAVPSGAFTVTDEIPAGTSFESASDGGTAVAGVVTWNVSVADQLVPGASVTLQSVLRVDDPAASPFTNTAEISADSGDDCDSTPDLDLTDDGLVDITDASLLTGGSCDNDLDSDDHDIAVLVVAPAPTPSTTSTTATDAAPPPTPVTTATDPADPAVSPLAGGAEAPTQLPITGTNSIVLLLAGALAISGGYVLLDVGARLAWRRRLAELMSRS